MATQYGTQSEAENALSEYQSFRSMQNESKATADGIRDGILGYHEEFPEYELRDGERGLTAVFIPQSTTTLDTQNMPNDVVLWAAAQGVFNLNSRLWNALKTSQAGDHQMIDQFERFVMKSTGGKPKFSIKKDR